MPSGGARPNTGPKLGSKHKKTLEKEAAREFVRQRITEALAPLLDAQLSHAVGLKYLVTRDKKTGKFIRVTEAMANHRAGTAAEEDGLDVLATEISQRDDLPPGVGPLIQSLAAERRKLRGETEAGEIIEVWEKDPSVQAFTDLMNRALDKPKEQAQDINLSGSIDVVQVLRQRLARRLKSSNP